MRIENPLKKHEFGFINSTVTSALKSALLLVVEKIIPRFFKADSFKKLRPQVIAASFLYMPQKRNL